MALNFNPIAWMNRFSKTGQYLTTDPTTDPNFNQLSGFSHSDSSEPISEEKRALLASFVSTISSRTELLNTLRSLRKSPIVQTIINAYINEGFYNNSKLEIYEYVIDHPQKDQINKMFAKFDEKFNMQSVIISLLPDLMVLGSNILTPIVDKNKKDGIIELLDNAILDDILPVYKGQIVEKYYRKAGSKLILEDSEKYILFSLPGEPIRVKVSYINEGTLNLPEYFKIPQSIFLHAIDMIKRLDMLDTANLALALRNILMPILLSIGVPAGTPIKDVIQLTEYYENHIEEMFSTIGNVQNVSVQSLLQLSSAIRALPQYADGKGTLQMLDIGSQKLPNSEQTNQIKKELALYTSTPFYHISTDGTVNDMDRTATLKNYGKFVQKINEIQFAAKMGLSDIYILHAKYSGIENFTRKNITISFKQTVNVDSLDLMELLTGSAASLNELYTSASNIANDENSGMEIDPEVVERLSNSIFSNVPAAKGLLKRRKPQEVIEETPVEETPTEEQDPAEEAVNNLKNDLSPEDFKDTEEK